MIAEADKKILIDSINAAEGFGKCWYAKPGGEPMCVVGQIASRLGVTNKQLNNWCPGSWSNVKGSSAVFREEYAPGSELVIAFERKTSANFQDLQTVWDRKGLYRTEEAARDAMRKLVEEL